ncbi:TIGR03084 family metal-binding protein [Streptomyces yaizuensis]|uniref:TIGR03084 family protein n=1 Tax=Streptomyces yaizuensis TaxID=2989713 RepID=A0ABQ5P8A7_9ACTN|nr:TIGR03084 family metal-binding protein [Streptomyces sp. YSPA8]GLF98801.1 TIGR03084 family protein [Streptomyces sp. YSPA8]
MSDLQNVLKDLTAAADETDRMVAGLTDEQWALDTPAPGWTVTQQIAHLSFIFRLAGTAASDPAAFRAMTEAAQKDFNAAVNAALNAYPLATPRAVLDRWRTERAACVDALAAVPPERPVPWLVNPLPPAVLACAGIMETFAHGQDVADALGLRREPADWLRHLVGFAVLTRDFGYQSRGLTPPAEPFRFELTAPSGAIWAHGPEDAADRITGPAHDFCLLVTRRRHRDDLDLTATGAAADHWLGIAQAYRGPAGPGRAPGQFAHLDRD